MDLPAGSIYFYNQLNGFDAINWPLRQVSLVKCIFITFSHYLLIWTVHHVVVVNGAFNVVIVNAPLFLPSRTSNVDRSISHILVLNGLHHFTQHGFSIPLPSIVGLPVGYTIAASSINITFTPKWTMGESSSLTDFLDEFPCTANISFLLVPPWIMHEV